MARNNSDEVSSDCNSCKAICCNHIPIEIERPKCKADYDTIRWYLMHKGVRVFLCHDNKWHIEFLSLCDNLTEKYKCRVYPSRPKLCRDYPPDGLLCESGEDGDAFTHLFQTAEEFEEYLENKGIEWQWRRMN